MTKKKENKEEKITRTVARTEDKTVQITFTIPAQIIAQNEEHILKELGQNLEVPGFRKGKAPIAKVKENVKPEKIIEEILTHIVLPALREALQEENIKPVIYPRFELLSAKEGENWQVRVTTCEMPEVKLGNYKEEIRKELKTTEIWTPDKKGGDGQKPTQEEKEQKVIEVLMKIIKVDVPTLLVEEEVNHRLSQLLERIEKLGLSLEKYLESTGKTAESLREEYENQTKQSLALELILNKIALDEKLEVDKKELDEVLKMSASLNSQDGQENSQEQREAIKNILLRRKALEFLTSLL